MFRELVLAANSCGDQKQKSSFVSLKQVTVGCVMPPNVSAPDPCCNLCCGTELTLVREDGLDSITSSFGQSCPAGYVPAEVYLAKNDILYEPLFGCYDYLQIASMLDHYLCYHLCGCQGSYSVLLAAAHFMQLHTQINPATLTAWVRQSTKPTAVISPLPEQILKSKYGSQHWALTTYGMEYQEIRKPLIALAGLAWGA